jgi:hypothetical protein
VGRAQPHILCFAPYTDWSIHSTRQVTILQALRRRGCTVSFVTCDGAFSDCDLLQEFTGAPAKRSANACLICQANVATKLAAWGMPYAWLGRYARSEDRRRAGAWVAHLDPSDYTEARYQDWPIGEWIRSSVYTHLRVNTVDLGDQRARTTFGSYLYSGLLAAFALERLFDEEKPDAQLLFNGRMGPTRIALEFAKRRGIRSIVEERAVLPGRLMLYDNESCLGLDGVDRLWTAWRDQPLTDTEIAEIGAVLEDRWRGRATDVSVFSRGLGDSDIRAALGFDPAKPLWALFTSSIDESADVPRIDSHYRTQEDWILATVEAVRSRPDVQLAIRVHPNAGSAKSLGRSAGDAAFFAALAPRLPSNARLIASDSPLSSYALAATADLGMVWYSSIGLEMAAMGRPVVRAVSYWLGKCDFIPALSGAATLAADLERYGGPTNAAAQRAIAIPAWRFAHMWYLRQSIPFPLVRQPKWFAGEMAWSSPAELEPGRDENLDRICDMFMHGRPVHDPPGARESPATGRESQLIWDRLAAAIGR